ncbi:hypothetical protein COBT_002195 [Conglomerata obtusa]
MELKAANHNWKKNFAKLVTFTLFIFVQHVTGSCKHSEHYLHQKHKLLIAKLSDQQSNYYEMTLSSEIYTSAFLYLDFVDEIARHFTIPIKELNTIRAKNVYLKTKFDEHTQTLTNSNYDTSEIQFQEDCNADYDLYSQKQIASQIYIISLISSTIKQNNAEYHDLQENWPVSELKMIHAYSCDNFNAKQIFLYWSKKQYLGILCKSKGFLLLLLEKCTTYDFFDFQGILELEQVFTDFLDCFDKFYITYDELHFKSKLQEES